MEIIKKYALAIRLNCSNNDFGNQDINEYFVVLIALDNPTLFKSEESLIFV